MTDPGMARGEVDFLLDLSRWPAAGGEAGALLDRLRSPDALGAVAPAGTVVLPPGVTPHLPELPAGWRVKSGSDSIHLAEQALEQASRNERPLLVLTEPLVPGSDLVGALAAALAEDPMFGAAIPRQRQPDGRIRPLVENGDGAGLPRRVLSEVPPLYVVPEIAAPCFLLRRELALNLEGLDRGFRTVRGAWLHYLCRARHLGFRCLVVNQAVLDAPPAGSEAALWDEGAEFWTLHRSFPDAALARKELASHAALRHEALLGPALETRGDERRRLLIDARGLQERYNGTTTAVLGLLEGLEALQSDWRTAVLVDPGPAEFHRLAERHPGWRLVHADPGTPFTAAVRLSQPWDLQTMIELHRMALLNFYLMLDTISWDVLYVGKWTHTLGATWRFLAEHADGLLFDSQFTRARFARRFDLSPATGEHVCRLSCAPADYAGRLDAEADGSPPFLFVVGNRLDHKFVRETVALLANAFPYLQIRALGDADRREGNVVTLHSGSTPEAELERCYSHARAVVFPSFYEGFGFPVLQGLSRGRPVVARRSELLSEVAADYAGPGTLHPFESPAELVEVVGGILHGGEVEGHPLGANLAAGAPARGWRAAAAGLLRFVEERAARPDAAHWLRRERRIEQMTVYFEQRR